MYFNIIKADYINNYKIKLEFENGKSGTVDLQEYVGNNDVFKDFSDMEYFKNFTLNNGTLTWAKGEIDIAPETLYLKATGEKEIKWNSLELSKV